MRRGAAFLLSAVLIGGTVPSPAFAQAQQEKQDTSAKPQTKKDLRKAYKELEYTYKQWLNEEVQYIITDEERQAFLRLATNEEREQFIEQFWLRRDPTPDTVENEFKEEHYRRITKVVCGPSLFSPEGIHIVAMPAAAERS